jgi:hypothetical protein
MTYRLFLSVLFCGVVVAVTSCSDPAGVGADLGDSSLENESVVARSIAVDSIGTTEAVSKTGIELRRSPVDGTVDRNWRFLFGTVDDPLAGTVTTEGYVDFVGTALRDSAFAAASADSLDAELRLRTTYAHGDTASNFDLQIYDLRSEADMQEAPADTTFATESQAIAQYRVTAPTDSLLTFELPQSWIEEHQAALQDSSEFGDDLNGLKLTTSGAGLVVGVDHASAVLRLTTSQDTVDFQSLKSFTRVERVGAPSVALSDWTLIQDGVGQRLLMKWDLDRPLFADSLRNSPLNRAAITVPIDTVKMSQEMPSNPDFVRPSVNGYRMLGTRTDQAPTCSQLGLGTLSDRGASCLLSTDPGSPPGAVSASPNVARQIFEDVLFDTPPFEAFEIETAVRTRDVPQNTTLRGVPSTLPVLVKTAERFETEDRPHATLVYTPL